MKQTKVYIYGTHAVTEALLGMPHVVKKVFFERGMDNTKIRALVTKAGIPSEPLDPQKVSSYVERNAPHQGVVALISEKELETPFLKFIDGFLPDRNTLLVFLGEITDPHNVGAIVRSAAAFGAAAVLAPRKKQALITPASIRTSAGMAFRIPLVVVENAQQAFSVLKEKGVKIYGLSADAKKPFVAEKFDTPTLLILGNEGEGIPPYAKAVCDQFLSIPINSQCESLNVAAAAAVALHSWSVKHPAALGRSAVQ